MTRFTDARPITIPPVGLEGELTQPQGRGGIVLFAHGSGSSRLSPRNRFVADGLHRAGLGTLLFDLLTPEEALDRRNVFAIPLLAERLVLATDWLVGEAGPGGRPLGYFGASTGAAAALMAAGMTRHPIGAIVSRGGRPDLAMPVLDRVRAPTLLIVGSLDTEVLALNEQALAALRCEKGLAVVDGATHLFEEPGTLERVVDHASRWFARRLAGPAASGDGDVP